jgi:hypothetical protein
MSWPPGRALAHGPAAEVLANRSRSSLAAAAPPAKHQRGSASPAAMASDLWIAASMRQSDDEIETIAARRTSGPRLLESS